MNSSLFQNSLPSDDLSQKLYNQVRSLQYDSTETIDDLLNDKERVLLKEVVRYIILAKDIVDQKSQANMIIQMNHMLTKTICVECGKNSHFFLALLFLLKNYTPVLPNYMTYEDVHDFLSNYENFRNYDRTEQELLFQIANWMNILFLFIPAKFNKGLVLASVTKIVEGYQANYITGKGQKSSVTDRVHIYEKEGNVQKLKRKRKSKLSQLSSSEELNTSNIEDTQSSSTYSETISDSDSLSVDLTMALPDNYAGYQMKRQKVEKLPPMPQMPLKNEMQQKRDYSFEFSFETKQENNALIDTPCCSSFSSTRPPRPSFPHYQVQQQPDREILTKPQMSLKPKQEEKKNMSIDKCDSVAELSSRTCNIGSIGSMQKKYGFGFYRHAGFGQRPANHIVYNAANLTTSRPYIASTFEEKEHSLSANKLSFGTCRGISHVTINIFSKDNSDSQESPEWSLISLIKDNAESREWSLMSLSSFMSDS